MLNLKADNLSWCPNVAHGFFGREGGVSQGIYASLNCGPGSNDTPEHVAENRRLVMEALAPGTNARLATLYQVHGTEVVTVEDVWPADARPHADAMATNQPGIALGILTADCAPILLADAEARVIGAAHAGWKGAISGVTDAVLAAMERLGAKRPRIRAAIGPCIGWDAYEVGAEFRDRFVAEDAANARFFGRSARAGHFRFALEDYVAERLRRAGAGNVEKTALCTYAHEADFFSYRRTTHREEPDYGRHISVILLSNP